MWGRKKIKEKDAIKEAKNMIEDVSIITCQDYTQNATYSTAVNALKMR